VYVHAGITMRYLRRHSLFTQRTLRVLAVRSALSLLTLLVLGCSVTRSNYKTLSFFFDGVPDPDAPVVIPETLSTSANPGQVKQVKLYQHKPYADGKCDSCHTPDKKQLLTLKADLCVKCHQPATNQYPVMHGPVTLGECLWCHEPHESDSPRLLKTTAPELCIQCHDQNLLPGNIPAHQSTTANCLECHTGHGGAKPSLLLVDNPTVQPITARLVPSAIPPPTTNVAPDAGGPP
jgi:predicted CXXCH cytochrome family protein